MNDLTLLEPLLKRFKLTGILDSLEHRLQQAVSGKWEYSYFLLQLMNDENDRKESNKISRRLIMSGLDMEKTLETFSFLFNPNIQEHVIKELATCNYIEKKQLVFFVGPSGVGKSHLAQALGHEACRRGYDTWYRKTDTIFKWLNSGRGDGTYESRLKRIIKTHLLILDDYGLKDLSLDQQNDLYEVISERYEKSSTIITSNRDFAEWPLVFTNPLMGSAAMDRLVHRAIKIVIEGRSYRLNNFVRNQL